MKGLIKATIDSSVFCQTCLKFLKKCINNQVPVFFDKVFPKYQRGFRKGFSAQHFLIKLLEQWKKSIDQGLVFGALLTDLSKVFDFYPMSYLLLNLVLMEWKIQQLD